MNQTRCLPALAVLILLSGAVACFPKTNPTTVMTAAGEINARELRVRSNELTAQLSGTLETAANDVYRAASDPAVRRNALAFKTKAVPALHRASFHTDALLSIADVWLLTVQLRDWVGTDAAREMFGEHQEILIAATRQMERRVLDFVESEGGNADSEARRKIEAFARTHPIEGAISTRATAITPLAERIRTTRMGAFSTVGSMAESIDDLSDRLAIYGEQLPMHARWQVELVLADQGIDSLDIAAAVSGLERLGDMSDRLMLFIDEAPVMIDERIDAAIPRMEAAFAGIDTEPFRRQVDEMISTHLAVTLNAITRERLAAEATIANEREIVLTEAERLFADVMNSSFERVEAQIDANLTRLIPLAFAVMAGPFVLGLLAGLLLRRKNPT